MGRNPIFRLPALRGLLGASVQILFMGLLGHYALCCYWNTGFRKLWETGVGFFPFLLSVIAAAGVLSVVFWAATIALRNLKVSQRSVWLVCGAVSLFYLSMAFFVPVTPKGDFYWYWEYGKRLAGGLEQSEPLLKIYALRALPYTNLVCRIFGESLLALRLCNVGLVLSATTLYYWTVKSVVNKKVALLSAALFALWPDTILAAATASHDIPGMFWLSLLFYSYARIVAPSESYQRVNAGVLSSLLCGIALGFLEMQRYGALITCAFLVVTVFCIAIRMPKTRREKVRRFALALLLPLAVAFVVKATANQFVRGSVTGEMKTIGILTAIDTSDSGGYFRIWTDKIYPSIPSQYRTDYCTKKVLSEVLDGPIDYFRHLLRKNRYLAHVNGYSHHHANKENPLVFALFNYSLSWLVGTLSLFSIGGLFFLNCPSDSTDAKNVPNLGLLFMVLLCGVLYSVILTLGEVHPRYDIFLAFAVPVLALRALERPPKCKVESRTWLFALGLLSLAFCSTLLLRPILSSMNLLLFNFQRSSEAINFNQNGIQILSTMPRRLLFRSDDTHPRTNRSADVQISLSLNREDIKAVSFILTPTVSKELEHSHFPWLFTVRQSGRVIYEERIVSASEPHFVRIPGSKFEQGEEATLEFELQESPSGRVAFHSSKKDQRNVLSIDYLDIETY
jgi:4-amino-4-deoxy-L-arabinose transferase-like glycosyltransferase